MDKIIGIYKITNKANGKVYIGESNNIYKRWEEHIDDLNNNKHHSHKLQSEWNKYGEENFTFDILEEIEKLDTYYKTTMQLIYIEDKYIKIYDSINSGYNVEDTVQEILNGNRVIMSEKIDAKYLSNLIDSKKINKSSEKMLNCVSIIDKFINNGYIVHFSKSELYRILESQNILTKVHNSFYINDEYIENGLFMNGKQSKNAYGFKFYRILITEKGELFITNLLNSLKLLSKV